MLFYLFFYLLAAVLIFQGVNLLREQTEPAKLVPLEVRPAALPAVRWGRYLATCGSVLALAGVGSQIWDGLAVLLVPLRLLGFASVAGYGLWLVLGRKVDYRPAPVAQDAHGHSH